MIEWIELIKPFLNIRGKVNVRDIDVEVVDHYVVIYVETSSEDEASLLADAIDIVKDRIKEAVKQ
jgi:hypothetical protein